MLLITARCPNLLEEELYLLCFYCFDGWRDVESSDGHFDANFIKLYKKIRCESKWTFLQWVDLKEISMRQLKGIFWHLTFNWLALLPERLTFLEDLLGMPQYRDSIPESILSSASSRTVGSGLFGSSGDTGKDNFELIKIWIICMAGYWVLLKCSFLKQRDRCKRKAKSAHWACLHRRNSSWKVCLGSVTPSCLKNSTTLHTIGAPPRTARCCSEFLSWNSAILLHDIFKKQNANLSSAFAWAIACFSCCLILLASFLFWSRNSAKSDCSSLKSATRFLFHSCKMFSSVGKKNTK